MGCGNQKYVEECENNLLLWYAIFQNSWGDICRNILAKIQQKSKTSQKCTCVIAIESTEQMVSHLFTNLNEKSESFQNIKSLSIYIFWFCPIESLGLVSVAVLIIYVSKRWNRWALMYFLNIILFISKYNNFNCKKQGNLFLPIHAQTKTIELFWKSSWFFKVSFFRFLKIKNKKDNVFTLKFQKFPGKLKG
jgi:hypothetical protein